MFAALLGVEEDGQLLATFQVTTTKPSVATSVTLSATTGGLAKVVVMKVNP